MIIGEWCVNRQRWSLTVGVRVWQRHSMPSELLKGPELIDTVEDGLRAVNQTTAQLLQVTQYGDVAVRLDPWGRNTHHSNLRVWGNNFLPNPQTWKKEREDKSHAAVQAVQSVFWPPQYCVEGLHSCIWATNESQTFIWMCCPFLLLAHIQTLNMTDELALVHKTHNSISLILNCGSPSDSNYTILQKVACFASLLRRSRWPTNLVCTALFLIKVPVWVYAHLTPAFTQ